MAEGGKRSKSRSPRVSSSPSPAAQSARSEQSKNRVEIRVTLLDGSDISLDVDRKIKAADVIERVHTEVDTGEKDYFSLYFFINTHKIFLDPLKTVKEQLLDDKQLPWRLNYGVKFYVPDPATLKEDHSRYLYCMQLCQDIKENRVLIDRESAMRLTALMIQASVGDYDPEAHKEGYIHEFNDFALLPKSKQPEHYDAKVVEVHKAKAGYTPAQAEAEFLQLAKKLPRYGTHLFGAQDEHHTLIHLGMSYKGVSVFREQTEVMHFPWPNIVKISYRRRKFRVRHRPTADATDRRSIATIKFVCGEPPAAKRVWKNAVEQHTFFRLMEPDQPNRVQDFFRRGSKFRYSGRTLSQTQRAKMEHPESKFTRSASARLYKKPSAEYAPGYVPAVEHYEIGKSDGEEKWLILERPPQDEPVDGTSREQQRVQVDFRVADGLPEGETHRYVIKKKERGYEVENATPEKTEPAYRLSVLDADAQMATTVVSLNIEPPSGRQEGGATTIYDSRRMPVVKLSGATVVTTTSVIEGPSGQAMSSGRVQQQYPLESLDISAEMTQLHALIGREPVQLAVDGSEEAAQVDLFLEREHEVVQKAFDGQEDTSVSLEIAVH